MQGVQVREIEWAPPKESPPFFVGGGRRPEGMAHGSGLQSFGRATGRFGADAFTLQEDGTLRCPAGASLWLSEVRQENVFTQRAVYLAYQTDCQRCALREQCLASGAKGDRARRVSAVRRLLPPPAPVPVERKTCLARTNPVGACSRSSTSRTWMTHWRRQHVEILPLVQTQRELAPPPVHRVPSVHTIAGVGRIGSAATPGADPRTCVSPFWRSPCTGPKRTVGE